MKSISANIILIFFSLTLETNGWEGNEIFTDTKILSGVLFAGVRCRLAKSFMHITPILENIADYSVKITNIVGIEYLKRFVM
jgi:hypothetical protein